LTHALASACPTVFAVERDPDLLQVLEAECDPERVRVVAGDAKEISFSEFCSADVQRVTVAGNLPYAITGAILRNLVTQCDRVACAVVMVQREVRDRLVAREDTAEYGALTVFTAQMFAIETVLHLPKTAFHPAPKVSSSIVRLRPLATPRARPSPAFEQVVRASFQARRKTLRKALAQALGGETSAALLTAAGIDGMRRGETLSIEEFGTLAEALANLTPNAS
jgi:16S rRNA (adenine1518-N6/adenine1519-N6)-dimethyltransferase